MFLFLCFFVFFKEERTLCDLVATCLLNLISEDD